MLENITRPACVARNRCRLAHVRKMATAFERFPFCNIFGAHHTLLLPAARRAGSDLATPRKILLTSGANRPGNHKAPYLHATLDALIQDDSLASRPREQPGLPATTSPGDPHQSPPD